VFRCRPISLLLIGLFLWVTACTSYTQIEIGEVPDHGKVRVTLTDGERETLRDPWVEASSIRSTDSHAIPLDQVAGLEAVGTNEGGTVFLVLGVTALVVVIVGCARACGTHTIEVTPF
jgi:hypothetical protein